MFPESSCVVVALQGVSPSDKERVFRIDETRMPSARIHGRVVDGDRASVDGVFVEVWQDSIVPSLVVFTNAEGRFETPKLPPGTYLICFEQEGFKRRKIEKVALTRNQDRDLDIVRLDRSRR